MHRMSREGRGKRIRGLGLVSCLALGLGQAAAAADMETVTYDIPAQSLAAALKSFAQQSNIQVMFAPDAVRDLDAPAVQGQYRPDAVLGQLLRRANLDYRYVGDDMVVVSAANGATPAPQAIQEESGPPEPAAAPATDGARESQGRTGFQIDEIVVTASKRSLRLQDVPMAVSALDATRLDRMGAQAFNDYLRSVPGVSFIDRGPGQNKIIIRGISDGPNTSTAATTAVYIDETPITETQWTADLTMFDIERVEVLRGPQGTLYGAGSMGGAVRIILNKPDPTAVSAAVEASLADTRYGAMSYDLKGMVNLPVVEDKFALRAVGYYRHEGGYIDNVTLGEKNISDADIKGGRILARFTPNDALNILASISHQDTEVDGRPQVDIALPGFQQARMVSEWQNNHWTLYSLQINYDFGWAELMSASSYYDKSSEYRTDFSSFLNPVLGVNPPVPLSLENTDAVEDIVQEIRLTSAGESRLQWLIGGYYSDRDGYNGQFGDSSPLPDDLPLPDLPLIAADIRQSLKEYAVFGELTYNVTERLQATVGARWFRIKHGFSADAGGLLFQPPMLYDHNTSESSENLKFLVAYEATPDNLVYAQAAQGFRVGGVNQPVPTDACAVDLAALGLTEAPRDYGSDSLWNYEVGTKNSFLQNRLTLNLAAYYIDWKDIQVNRILPNCAIGFIDNGGSATSKGLEVEVAARPVKGLEVTANVAYTKTEIGTSVPSVGAIEGDPLPNVPKWTANLTAQYSFPLTADLGAYLRGEIQHIGSSLNDFTGLGPASISQASYQIGTLRVGVEAEYWEAALFVDNVWDEKAQTYTQLSFVNPHYTSNPPRTVGIILKGRF